MFVSFYAIWQVVFNIYKKKKGSQMAKILEKKVLLGAVWGRLLLTVRRHPGVVAIKTVWCWY